MAWKVDYEAHVRSEIRDQLASGILSKNDLQALSKWVEQVETYGLAHVQTDYWNDHPLEAEWTGLRSASFSRRGRIIYRIENDRLVIMVVRVTATHNYRK